MAFVILNIDIVGGFFRACMQGAVALYYYLHVAN